MSTALHSEKDLLQTRRTEAHAHALAVQRVPATLSLAAVILSVLGLRA